MQSLAHNIYHSSLKFIIFLSVRTILVFREDRSKYTVFTNKDTLNGDTTNFLFNRPVVFFVVDFFYSVHRPRTMITTNRNFNNTLALKTYIASFENHPFDLFIKCQKLISFKRQTILSYGFLKWILT